MKKALALLLALVMCLSLCACGNSPEAVPLELMFCLNWWTTDNSNDAPVVTVYDDGEAFIEIDGGRVFYTWNEIVPLGTENGITAAEIQLYQNRKKAITVRFYHNPNGLDTAVLGDLTLYKIEDIAEGKAFPESSETLVPETTAIPDPVYETIEITIDNWQEYFAFRQSEGEWEEDAFGDAVRYRRYVYFSLKDEYQDKVASMDVALSCSYTVDYRYYEIDLQNRVFTIGEIYKSDVKESRPESIYYTPYAVWDVYCSENPGMFTLDTNIPILEWVDTMDVARIQGTIEIQTN